jgi:hypothetical protein
MTALGRRQVDGGKFPAQEVSRGILQPALQSEEVLLGQHGVRPRTAHIEHDDLVAIAECRQGEMHATRTRTHD